MSQSRRASLIRVCHPLPVLLNASTTSVSRRMLRCSFGEAEGGRPRRRERSSLAVFLPTTSDSTSAAGRARLNQSAVASGASSSMSSGSGLRGISVPFATVGSAQADHVNRPITRGKHEHVQLIMDQAQGLEAALTVFLSDVLDDQSRVPLEVVCQGEREAATLDASLVLGRIEGDRHAVIVPTVTVDRNGLAGVKRQPGITGCSSGHLTRPAACYRKPPSASNAAQLRRYASLMRRRVGQGFGER